MSSSVLTADISAKLDAKLDVELCAELNFELAYTQVWCRDGHTHTFVLSSELSYS